MKKLPIPAARWASLAVMSLFAVASLSPSARADEKPIKALLVAGGCCHDYEGQHKALFEGIQARANVQVDVWWTDDKSTEPPLPLYDDPNWADGYDIIIHDECAAGNKDLKVMKHILDAHKTIPSVHLHCAMHSFRNDTDQWFKHLGLQSSRHGPKKPIDIEFVDKKHPITATLENWTTIDEELYNNVDVFDAVPLAIGKQKVMQEGKEVEEVSIVVWTNEKQGARSFSTTIGHNTETVEDPRYLDLVTRGLLWACDKLNDDYLGKPFTGENKITFVKGKPKPEKKKPAPKKQASLGPAPKNATLAAVTASSEESNKANYTWQAIDGSRDTRWCAANPSQPQWIQLAFDQPQNVTGAKIVWESGGTYRHRIEGSKDGKQWTLLADATDNQKAGDTNDAFTADGIRFLKITCTGTSGGWASIREISLGGIASLYPKLDAQQKEAVKKSEAAAADPYKTEGNIPPKIVKLTREEEAAILNDVTVANGFDVSLFSPWQTANYPVYVAAAPNGDLYVSSGGNGSVGRDPHRGRVLRLRDTDDDGRADEVKEFIKDVPAPRGLIWDKDRLILLHPPDISVHIDKDGDGIADESKTIIEGIAFGFDQRPPDHTTNGLELGIDGWVYIAGGDFGFMDAKGSDGRTLQHRGGGVIRFRPDGSGLEIFATGTRNILGTPISPLLDIFARDNTNDGGGWDVRFHNFTGLEDHGYPRLYKNFGDEHIQPLADYGGGSGCGSVYISEPGFPEEWNNAPFTCDWGTGALWKHTVERKGATFVEITDPQPLIKMTRPTDADIDGLGHIYQASWKGPATFRWEGPENGYIVRVTPKGYQAKPLPDFAKLKDAELVALLDTESQVRRLAAQRELLRREPSAETTDALVEVAGDDSKSLATRVAALYAVAQRGTDSRHSAAVIEELKPLAIDPALQPFVLRALGDMAIDTITAGKSGPAPLDLIIAGVESEDVRTRVEAIVAAARQKLAAAAPSIAVALGSEDPVIAHTAYRALASLKSADACFAVLDADKFSETARRHASYALMRMHEKSVVDGVLSRLEEEERPEVRHDLLSILTRLYYTEGEWEGDSWGTRPDTRGPYYQLATWSESDRILAALKKALASAKPGEAAFLVKEMNRNRIQSNEALQRVITMANEDGSLVPEAVAQIAAAEEVPGDGIPILLKAAADPESAPGTLAGAVEGLMKTDNPEAVEISLSALAALDKTKGSNKDVERGRNGFLKAPKLENHHLAVEEYAAAHPDTREGLWANAALIELASRTTGSPESKEMSGKAIDVAWANPKQKIALMKAAGEMRVHFLDDRIKIALTDPDAGIAKTAKSIASRLKIPVGNSDNTPKIATLSPDQALKQIVETKGDIALGEAVFSRATCVACHTVSQDQPQKGPYLGNIAQTYQRPQLVEAVLDPNKTIAQGFATNVVSLKDGTTLMGFVTDESGDTVTLRDITSQAHTFKKTDIAKRDTLPTSIMPPGLLMNFSVKEAASLFDYIQALAKK